MIKEEHHATALQAPHTDNRDARTTHSKSGHAASLVLSAPRLLHLRTWKAVTRSFCPTESKPDCDDASTPHTEPSLGFGRGASDMKSTCGDIAGSEAGERSGPRSDFFVGLLAAATVAKDVTARSRSRNGLSRQWDQCLQ